MNRRWFSLLLVTLGVLALPFRAPAPLVYTPGEGLTYEPVGGPGKWTRTKAKEQLDVALEAFNQQDYSLATKAARRVVRMWPLSDYAPQAQYIVGRCYEAKGQDEKAFDEYQKILNKYPKSENADDVLKREFVISERYLHGQWFKLWGYIPFFPDMEKTAAMFEKIVAHGPYSDVAPHAQLRVGAAREKRQDYPGAATAYELAADRYHDRPAIAADATYRTGLVYEKQAATAEYDQSMASKAIAAYGDFLTYYPDDPRASEVRKSMDKLSAEQARGNFEIARYYEKHKKWNGALVYYNEVVLKDPGSAYATQARKRIDEIKQRIKPTAN